MGWKEWRKKFPKTTQERLDDNLIHSTLNHRLFFLLPHPYAISP